VIALLAALENIVPPVPADTAVALGAFLAARGAPISTTAVFLVTWVANVTSAVGMYYVARTVGRPFVESRTGRRLLSPRALRALERAYQRHHLWGIFLSRFLPGYRAVVPPFAGIAGLAALRALPPVVVASGLYYGLLVFLAHRIGANWDSLTRVLRQLGWWLGAIAAVATALLAWALVRWRRRQDDAG
jgi:membrane protein DedA with SNARE-associated domain